MVAQAAALLDLVELLTSGGSAGEAATHAEAALRLYDHKRDVVSSASEPEFLARVGH